MCERDMPVSRGTCIFGLIANARSFANTQVRGISSWRIGLSIPARQTRHHARAIRLAGTSKAERNPVSSRARENRFSLLAKVTMSTTLHSGGTTVAPLYLSLLPSSLLAEVNPLLAIHAWRSHVSLVTLPLPPQKHLPMPTLRRRIPTCMKSS